MKSEEDHELVKRCQGGEVFAFEVLVERYKEKACSIAYRFTRNDEDALDLSQEAFVKAYQSIHSFKSSSTFYTWLYRIVVNLCIDFQRKRKKENSLREDLSDWREEKELVSDNPSLSPEDRVMRKELRESIQRGLDLLSPHHRQILVLRDFEDFSYKEIAEVVNISEGTVMSRLYHARRKLKDILESYVMEG